MKPVVGISAFPRTLEIAIGPARCHTVSHFYPDAVVLAGGVPVVLPMLAPEETPDLVGAVDAVVLTGGGDIDPSLYGADAAPETHDVDPGRDAFDVALVRAAVERGVPVLAICRGIQVVNVALGGSLVQHVPAWSGTPHGHANRWNEGVHGVKVDADSQLAAALGCTELAVNSLHHQAVDEPAAGVRPVAWSDDGVVEGIEVEGHPEVLAVQWHPEFLPDRSDQLGLFRWVVDQAAARRQTV